MFPSYNIIFHELIYHDSRRYIFVIADFKNEIFLKIIVLNYKKFLDLIYDSAMIINKSYVNVRINYAE